MPDAATPHPNPLSAALAAAVTVLESHQIQYAVVGGIAAAVWGEPRTTFDVDLVVAIPPADDERLAEAFRRDARFPIDPTFVPMPPDLRIVRAHLPDQSEPALKLILIDCLIVEEQFGNSVVSRRVQADFAGTPIWVASREDLIVLKLMAARPKDQEDVRAVLRNYRERIDRAYVNHWADRFRCRPLWDKLLATAME